MRVLGTLGVLPRHVSCGRGGGGHSPRPQLLSESARKLGEPRGAAVAAARPSKPDGLTMPGDTTPAIGQFRQLRRSGPRRKVDLALARTHFSRAVRSAMAPAELALCSGPSRVRRHRRWPGLTYEMELVCVECGAGGSRCPRLEGVPDRR